MPLELLLGAFALMSGLGVNSTAKHFEPDDGRGSPPGAPLPPPPPSMHAYAGHQMQLARFGQEVRLRPAGNGHYYAHATIGGRQVLMMVDTGCTGVVIDHATARALGVPLHRVRYDTPVRAGNGVHYAHRFAIPELIVEGRLAARDVDAVVHRDDGGPNLLGMSFLGRFHVEMAGGELIIRG
jgi:clan AA aspartic protease (TIGR02281 family)